jgi:erythromycin esterase-like protein
LPAVNSAYGLVAALNLPTGTEGSDLPQFQTALASAQSVLGQLQANRDKYLQQMSAKQVDWAIQNATVVVQAVQYGVDGGGATYVASAYRDSAMAVDAEWIAAQSPPGSRIVFWAHNEHINKEPGTMGGLLAQYFGADYVTLGTAFHSGTYRAGYNPIFPPGAARDDAGIFPTLESFPGSVECVLHETGTPQQILILGLANANDPASSWLLFGLEFRGIGWEQEDGFWEFYPASRLTPDFDGLIFFDQATGATGFPWPRKLKARQSSGIGSLGRAHRGRVSVFAWYALRERFFETLEAGRRPNGCTMLAVAAACRVCREG